MKSLCSISEGLPFSELPRLLKVLSEEVTSFIDLKLALFRRELWQEGRDFLKDLIGIGVAAVVAFTGFEVLIFGLVFALNLWVHNLVLSFFIVGGLCLAVGGVTIVFLGRRLQNINLARNRTELRRDKEWIKMQTSQS